MNDMLSWQMQAFRRVFNVLNPAATTNVHAAPQNQLMVLLPRTDPTPLLYQRTKYPWWINWMYGLVGLNILMTCVACLIALDPT